MIKTIKHHINLVKSLFRNKHPRSPEWRKVEKDFLSSHPECAACSGKSHLQVHHIVPFHIDRKLELDEKNLITLCMGERECHLKIGHSGNWKSYCPEVAKYAAEIKNGSKTFEEIYKIALNNRIT